MLNTQPSALLCFLETTRMWANMPNVMAALSNIGGALCSTPQSLADAHYTKVPCSNAAKTRNPLKFAGVPQTRQQISAVCGPKFTTSWGHVDEVMLFYRFFYRATQLC